MARVRVMYWKENPVQVQAEDDSGVVSRQLDERFQQGVGALSMFDGSAGGDQYLMAWEWGEYTEAPGSARETADRLAEGINGSFPRDFVARIRELRLSGERDPRPGAVDSWFKDAD